ncbi:MAG: hypothetical protein HQL46_09615 [Gammaproteobacteria bacterium]|nr:hypothetical protein [Gammaproteobacteria bacterium]
MTSFVIFSIFSYCLISYLYQQNHQDQLEKISENYSRSYQMAYQQFNFFSRVFYKVIVQKTHVEEIYEQVYQAKNEQEINRLRTALYNKIIKQYKDLSETINLRQLHFHLKNNDSFLRMHRPEKYGDNLSLIRPTVASVNKSHQSIDGFEEGKIYNGFRFVFPVTSKKGVHLGSMEISFDAVAIISKLIQHYDISTQFYVNESVIEKKVFSDEKSNYQASEFKGYLADKSVVDILSSYNINKLHMNIAPITIKKLLSNIKTGKTHSEHDDNLHLILTTIPIHNPITSKLVAFFLIKSVDNLHIKFYHNFWFIVLCAELLLVIIFLAIYLQLSKQYLYQDMLADLTLSKVQVDKKTEELNILNKNLGNIVEQQILELRAKDSALQQQTKLALMGEMIGAIAHQWRQPLNALNINIQNLDDDYEDGLIDEKFINNFIKKNHKTIEFMSQTIESFRNFFKIDKIKDTFSVYESIEETINILSSQFKHYEIEFEVIGNDFKLYGLKSEFHQVLLNLVNNAKDAILDNYKNQLEQGKKSADSGIILIELKIKDNIRKISVLDNAGGIPEKILPRIFEPYFTTKSPDKGTGIGLYMSKMIVEKNMNGRLSVENTGFFNTQEQFVKGALFTMTFDNNIE